MEAIRTYIDNVFKAFPQNRRVAVLKRDMLAGMEEKYNALKDEGKSENEAVGSVIADFGSIDEIAAELGVSTVSDSDSNTGSDIPAVAPEPVGANPFVPVSNEEAFGFLEQIDKSGKWIGIGVWLIIAGAAAMLIMSGNVSSGLGVFTLFIAIIPAVALFIIHGMTLSRYYEKFEGNTLLLDKSTREELEQERNRFIPRFTAFITTGVSVVLLSVAIFLLLQDCGVESVPLSVMLLLIGGATFLFIKVGMVYYAYDMLLGRGDYLNLSTTVEQINAVHAELDKTLTQIAAVRNSRSGRKQSERIIGTVASVFWPIITAAYLLWSFAADSWGVSWIIWPIAGILFGAFAGGISTWYEGKDN